MAKEFLYEVLVRGGPDGLAGAHQIVAMLEDDGSIRLGAPAPLDPPLAAAVLGENLASLSGALEQARARIAELEAKLAEAPAAPARAGVDWLSFMALFTGAEQSAVALSSDPRAAVFRMMATGLGGDLVLDDPRVAQGLDALILAGCIAADRKAEILAGRAPA